VENGQQNYPIHLKIDTGMNRLGLKHKKEITAIVDFIKQKELLKIQSVFSHLAASDEPTMDDFTQAQFNTFEKNFALIASQFDYKIEKHLLNSAGIERFPHKQFDMVRLGIGLYGISQTGMILENVGTLRSTISQLKTVTADETIGYSRKGQVKKTSKIAIVPLGYADGLDRKLGNGNGNAFINGCFAPIIGNICMDMLMLDVSEIEVKVGDAVEFFGPNISIAELADKLGTIPYEVLTGISQRVKRVYTQE
jgi:alanine racemase